MTPIIGSELFKAMTACGRYCGEEEIIECIKYMRDQVAEGEDPAEILHDEGFEPDYIFDLL